MILDGSWLQNIHKSARKKPVYWGRQSSNSVGGEGCLFDLPYRTKIITQKLLIKSLFGSLALASYWLTHILVNPFLLIYISSHDSGLPDKILFLCLQWFHGVTLWLHLSFSQHLVYFFPPSSVRLQLSCRLKAVPLFTNESILLHQNTLKKSQYYYCL